MSTFDEPNPDAGLPQPFVMPPDPNQMVVDAFAERIKEFWRRPIACPICESQAWTIRYAVDASLRYGIADDPKVVTLIPVECNTCAYVMFFNGVGLGLFHDGEPIGLADEPESE